jgi:hypothetical protein
VTVELVLQHENTTYVILVDANVFRRLAQRLRETGIVTPTAEVNGGLPQIVHTPANEDTIIAPAEQQPHDITLLLQTPVFEAQ